MILGHPQAQNPDWTTGIPLMLKMGTTYLQLLAICMYTWFIIFRNPQPHAILYCYVAVYTPLYSYIILIKWLLCCFWDTNGINFLLLQEDAIRQVLDEINTLFEHNVQDM